MLSAGDVESQSNQIILSILLWIALTFLISFILFLVRIIVRRGQDERVVFKSSFWWTLLFVSVIVLGKYLNERKMLDLTNALTLLAIAVFGSMFLRLSLNRKIN